MPSVRFLASEHRAYVVTVILLFGKIMPTCSCYVLKGLVYIIIIALLGRQPSFYTKYTKLNICLFCDVRLVSNAKCIYLMRSCVL